MKALTEETGVKADEPAAAEGEMMMEAEMMEGGDDMMEGDGMALPEAEPAWDPYEGDGGAYDGFGNLPSMLLRISAKNEYGGDLMKAQVLKWEFNFDDKPDDSASWGKSISSLDELKDDAERLKTAFEKPVLKVMRKARGYELVDVNTGEDAYAEPPAGLTE